MMFPFYISKRFTFSRKDSRFFSFISVISVIGISLGVATLIIALSILKGFEKTITNKIIDFDSHIKLSSLIATLPGCSITTARITPLYVELSPGFKKGFI